MNTLTRLLVATLVLNSISAAFAVGNLAIAIAKPAKVSGYCPCRDGHPCECRPGDCYCGPDCTCDLPEPCQPGK